MVKKLGIFAQQHIYLAQLQTSIFISDIIVEFVRNCGPVMTFAFFNI
jgi:hypothetical protein